MQRFLYGIVLLPIPLSGFAFNGTPRHIIFVGDKPQIFEANLRLHRWRRFQEICFRKSANGRSLNEVHRKISAGNIPRPSIEGPIRSGCHRSDGQLKQKQQRKERNQKQSGTASDSHNLKPYFEARLENMPSLWSKRDARPIPVYDIASRRECSPSEERPADTYSVAAPVAPSFRCERCGDASSTRWTSADPFTRATFMALAAGRARSPRWSSALAAWSATYC